MKPIISVIVPCYNYAKFLPFALESILAQTMEHWECIIVDDGSVDDTKTVAKGYVKRDARFKYVHQHNQGLSAARNTGMKNSSGKYLQFLDADDLLCEYKLAMQCEYLEKNPGVDIIYGDELFFNTDEPEIKFKGRYNASNRFQYLKISGRGMSMVKVFATDNFISVSSPLVRHKVVEKVGYFDISYRSYEDWHFWFRCAVSNVSFGYVPVHGTETYIRTGHTSMMTNTRKLVDAGILLRNFMMVRLPLSLKLYNIYRLLKLYAHKLALKQGK